MEDVFFAAVTKATQAAGNPVQGPWAHVLEAMKIKGTDTGALASMTSEQLLAQTQTALREGRATGARAAKAMLDSYAALVSGVLIGMSEGQEPQAAAPKAAKSRTKA